MVKILAFDTETTKLPPIGNTPGLSYKEKQLIEKALLEQNSDLLWNQWINFWPHIIQLSY